MRTEASLVCSREVLGADSGELSFSSSRLRRRVRFVAAMELASHGGCGVDVSMVGVVVELEDSSTSC